MTDDANRSTWDELLALTSFRLLRASRGVTRNERRYTVCDPFTRVLVPIEGEAFYRMMNRNIHLVPGQMMLVPTDAELKCHHLRGWRVNALYCRVDLAGLTDWFSLVPPTRLVMTWAGAGDTIDRLIEADRSEGLGARLEAMTRLLELLTPFLAASDTAGLREAVSRLGRIRPVLRHIDQHLAEPMSLATLAPLVHLSPKYFANLFSEIVGVGPIAYVNRRRVQRAKELLLLTTLPIQQVAAMVGFDNPFYFSRQFRQLEGVSPTAYRQACARPE